jgi:hypothetical protein
MWLEGMRRYITYISDEQCDQ